MIKLRIKDIILITLLCLSFTINGFAEINSEIKFKINEKIITNIDIDNEKKFLIFLNPQLNNLPNSQIQTITEKSIKNRLIKEIELEKIYDLNKIEVGEEYIDRFISKNKIPNKEVLKQELTKINLSYEYFKNSFLVDNVWREFIYKKFQSKVKIDIEKLKKQIQNQESEVEELNLSEILFEPKTNMSLENLTNEIYQTIKGSGFEAAASIYSISDSKKFGGKLGWIKSNQISKDIFSRIGEKEITNPIQTRNGYLILKINDKRKVKQKIDYDDELKRLTNLETDKELNKLGYIYFNKVKKRIFISEN